MQVSDYEKIVETRIETWREIVHTGGGIYEEQETGGVLWIRTAAGALFGIEPERGETLEDMLRHYNRTGCLDGRCKLMSHE